MSWFVTQDGKNDITLFLADRKKTRTQWWTSQLDLAMEFEKEESASVQLKKLRYNNPQVVNYENALEIYHSNQHHQIINEEHPFSSDALGQD